MIDIFSVTFLLGIIFGLFAGFTIKSYFSKKMKVKSTLMIMQKI